MSLWDYVLNYKNQIVNRKVYIGDWLRAAINAEYLKEARMESRWASCMGKSEADSHKGGSLHYSFYIKSLNNETIVIEDSIDFRNRILDIELLIRANETNGSYYIDILNREAPYTYGTQATITRITGAKTQATDPPKTVDNFPAYINSKWWWQAMYSGVIFTSDGSGSGIPLSFGYRSPYSSDFFTSLNNEVLLNINASNEIEITNSGSTEIAIIGSIRAGVQS